MYIELIELLFLAVILIIVINNSRKSIKNYMPTNKQKAVVLDSCALIDGRIIDIAKAGFISPNLVVPDFILAELQLLADGSDSQKRERARYGLEVVKILQAEPVLDVNISKKTITADNTDDKLVKLALTLRADLFTTDFNLNQVASIHGVRVLNVNELTHTLRPNTLPGEEIDVKVIQIGSSKEQGVGYTQDGTMVVIDNASRDIGKNIRVQITRSHQTVAGKMLFAKKALNKASLKKILPNHPKITSNKTNKQSYQTNKMTKQEQSLFKAIDEANG